MADDCVFCRIVSGELPVELLYADEHVVAFADVAPKAEVHILVVPRRHVVDVVELADDPAALAALVRAGAALAAERADGAFRLVFNTGAAAGQSVFHAHGHVLAGAGASSGGL
ncbi:HIT domain-containing protein [Aquipuribacter hungaricus]|uniref:HIT domain-containing protein n=1 Tax=Aquipuribacter hungaricus TaxID=545624 RepID=A0ABV7WH74_9MICO